MGEGEAIVLGAGGREARRDGQLHRQKKAKGHRTCGNRTYVDALMLVENVSRRALLLLLLLLLLRALLPRQPRYKPVVGGVEKVRDLDLTCV